MADPPPRRGRRLLILPPLVIGIAIVVWLVGSREGPEESGASERQTAVRVLRAAKTNVVPRVIGYGVVEPGKVWQAVAQVAGQVIEKNEKAETGAPATAGTVLLRIDPREYELAILETEAQIAKLQADLAELGTRKDNTQRTLEIEKRSLKTYERELARKKELAEESVVAQSEADQEESRYLQQLVRVQDLENTLKLIPAERESLEANVRANEAKLDLAKLDLSYTTIEAPFACRLVQVDFEASQYVSVGEVLAEAHGVDVAEISAQVPISKIRHLIPKLPTGPALVTEFLEGDIIAELGLDAEVRIRTGGFEASWDGRVDRIGATIDPETRTLGVVVAVDAPYELAVPGSRPPLVKDMFCEVEIRGPAKPGKILIPRAALHAGEVYVVEGDRLRRRPVQVEFSLHDFVCLTSGLEDGDVVVASDPVPAIDGMLLQTTLDEALEERIAAVARGEAEIR